MEEMASQSDPRKEPSLSQIPAVPLTLEGACMLHQMFRFNWAAWRKLTETERAGMLEVSLPVLRSICDPAAHAAAGKQSGLFSQLGHKGDLMMVHVRPSLDALNAVELHLASTPLYDFLDLRHSYVSVVELGLYESTAKTYATLIEAGKQPHTPEWDAGLAEVLERQRAAMHPRLFPALPTSKYVCFYPMDRRRGEHANWYTVPMAERQRMMHEHGLVGRRYAGEVRQIISGSIGWDDWEWGVDLFADDPVVFKRLIYEMRFDEVSAVYALFGAFYLGIRLDIFGLPDWLGGRLPGQPDKAES
jgi:peroxiredoxin